MHKALVISDDTTTNPTLDAAARRIGCDLHLHTDPAAAIDAVGNVMPSLIIIDFSLADGDGYVWRYAGLNACRAVRSIYSETFPILMIADETGPEVRHACLGAGADDVWPGDLDVAGLRKRLRFWLRLSSIRHERLHEDGDLLMDFEDGLFNSAHLPSVATAFSRAKAGV